MIFSHLDKLIDYALCKNLIEECDLYVVRNNLIDALRLDEVKVTGEKWQGETVEELLSPIIDFAVANEIIPDTNNSKDLFDTLIMGIFTPMPREVIAKFMALYNESPEKATDWYYEISKNLNYVRAERIKKDLRWKYSSEFGELDITINCSKPEKDPRDIALAGKSKASAYPACQLCSENMGFRGHATHPARQNLRPVPIKVADKDWFFQYSPYGYYSEHTIFFNREHTPMVIDEKVFGKLFDIIDYLPHYFVGSNAGLPIVGGSILSHEHFQGGRYTFAMNTAPIEYEFTLNAFPNVKACIVKWPLSVIRLSSPDKNEMAKACAFVLSKWEGYTDEEAFIFAETDGAKHNAVTPIARRNGADYECDIVLRNNITTPERPMGLYHPRAEYHHIKKENIGLIEVMGLAVLPARLKANIPLLAEALISGKDISLDENLSSHATWLSEVRKNRTDATADNAESIIKEEIGKVFMLVLMDAGVFKRDEMGKRAFLKFIEYLNK